MKKLHLKFLMKRLPSFYLLNSYLDPLPGFSRIGMFVLFHIKFNNQSYTIYSTYIASIYFVNIAVIS